MVELSAVSVRFLRRHPTASGGRPMLAECLQF
jgi:hypothetical protein